MSEDGTKNGSLARPDSGGDSDEASDADRDPAGDPAPTSTGRRHRRRGALAASAVVVAAVVALAAALVGVTGSRDDLEDAASERRQVAAVAAEVAQTITEFDHTDLDAGLSAVAALTTERLEAEYLEAFERLRPGIVEARGRLVTTVEEVYVGDVGAEQASAIVVLTLVFDSTAGRRELRDSFLQVRLVRTREGWRADDVLTVNAGVGDGPVGVLDEAGGGSDDGEPGDDQP